MAVDRKELWGSWMFRSQSARSIDEFNSFSNGTDTLGTVYRELLQEFEEKKTFEYSPSDLCEYCNDKVSNDSQLECDIVQQIVSTEGVDCDIFCSEFLLKCIKDYYNCIQNVVNILSCKNEDKLCVILEETWDKLMEIDYKKRFVVAIMSNDKADLFCRRIVLKSFQTLDFEKALDNVTPVATLLDGFIVGEVALPLLEAEDSVLVSNRSCLTAFLCCLEKDQKYKLMKGFLHKIEKNIFSWHFKIITTLIEENIYDVQIMEELLYVLKTAVTIHNKHNFLGKLLVLIVDHIQLSASHELITLLVHITDNYQGTGKLSIRNKTKSLVHRISMNH